MAELTAFLLVVGVLLATVTVVGHVIWILIAAIFRGLSGRKSASAEDAAFRAATRVTNRASALGALRCLLDEMVGRGAIDVETRTRLSAAITAEERRATAGLVHPATAVPKVCPPLAGDAVDAAPIATVVATDPATEHGRGTPRPITSADFVPAVTPAAPASTPLRERAKKFAASRALAGELAVDELAPAKAAKAAVGPPAVPVSRLFAAFMEENNIRWGELVGGLLIVGCSIALVISLWSEIAGRPLLQFVLFNGVTAALFGVGMYTDRRWKIHTTSRGVLAIATLLVPLNFLALAAFTHASPPTSVLPLVGEIGSLVVFSWLIFFAARVLVSSDAMLLMLGVMLPCVAQLLVRRFGSPAMPLAGLYVLAGLPIAAYLVSAMAASRRRWCGEMGEADANRLLVFLGLVTAAAVMPLALLLYVAPPMRDAVHRLSPLLAVCGVPALLVGLLFWRRVQKKELGGLQTAGIAVGALGVMVMAAGIVFAWPDPALMLPALLAAGMALLIVAVWFGVPAAHVPAGFAFATAALVGYYVLRGAVGWTMETGVPLTEALLSATSGHLLLPIAAVFALVSWRLRRAGRGEASAMYGLVTAGTAAASLALAIWFGFARAGDPHHVTWLLAVYAAGAVAAAIGLGRTDVARAGAALLLAASVQAVVYRYGAVWGLPLPWVGALLAHAAVLVHPATAVPKVCPPLAGDAVDAATITSVVALVWLVARMDALSWFGAGCYLAGCAVIWLALAVLQVSPVLFTMSQGATVAAIVCFVAAAAATREWYSAARFPWIDPWMWQAQGVALAGYCVLLGGVRWLVRRGTTDSDVNVLPAREDAWVQRARVVLEPAWPSWDDVVRLLVVGGTAVVACYAAVPGIGQELALSAVRGMREVSSAEGFELPAAPHGHAAGMGGWVLLFSAATALVVVLWRRESRRWVVAGLAIVAMGACLLLAARWET